MKREDDTLQGLWQAYQQAQPPQAPGAEALNSVAAWLDGGRPDDETIEAILADQPALRDAVAAIGLETEVTQEPVTPALEQQLLHGVLQHFDAHRPAPRRPAVIGSIGIQVAAAAAAIAVASLGFIFGRVAAPATNEATNDFVAIVTFEMLADDDNLESILMTTGLAADLTPQGEAP